VDHESGWLNWQWCSTGGEQRGTLEDDLAIMWSPGRKSASLTGVTSEYHSFRDSLPDNLLSQGEIAYRRAVRFAHSMKGKEQTPEEVEWLARQIAAAMDHHMFAEVTSLLDRLRPQEYPWAVIAERYLPAQADAIVRDAATSTNATDEISTLSDQVEKFGIAGLSPAQLLLLVMVCLLAVGLPFAQVALPQGAQAVLADEEATIGLGLAITLAILQGGKK
jgi:hypothetical protein